MNKFLAVLAAAFLMAAAVPARAQDAQPPQSDVQVAPDQQGQPAPDDQSSQEISDADYQKASESQPGVARVSVAEGDVSTQRGDNGEWVAVTQNTPISPDDRISTGDKSRAEIELNGTNVLRMSERSTARIAAISRNEIHVQIGQGLVTYNVIRGSEARSVIDTPNSSIRPLDPEGEYRIVVNSDSETKVIVRRGSVEVTTSQGSTRVEKGNMITVAGTDAPKYQVSLAPERDDWDQWNSERNRGIRSAQSWHNTNPNYTGSEDLDRNGVWSEIPDYGPVWTPSVAPGWAPYRAGRWVYQPYYGWTWVSYEPWGWAPYHYGRWFVYGGNWVWWPGPVGVYPGYYPVWAPAYVSFFGWGAPGFGIGIGFGFGFGFGFGHVGWLAVGPGDHFHPWFGRFGGGVHAVGVANIHGGGFANRGVAPLAGNRGTQFSNVNGALTNSHIRSGMSSMDSNQFGKSAVPSHQTALSAASFKQASMMTGKTGISPSRQSYSSTDKSPGVSSVRNATSRSQHFFNASSKPSTTSASNAGSRASGANSTSRTTANSGARSASNSQSASRPGPSASRPATSSSRTAPAQGTQSARGGWQRSTPPTQSANNRSPYGQSPYGRAGQSPYGSRGGAYGPYSRPPLNMNRPIVQPRGGYPGGRPGAPAGGAARGAPGAPPSGAAPHGGSAGSAPRGGSAPHGGGGGGHAGGSHR
jgi:hypothetical protein